MIEGSLTNRGRDPENMQVIVQEKKQVMMELSVYLTDETGVFEGTQKRAEKSPEQKSKHFVDRDAESQMESELLELKTKWEHLKQTISLLTDRMSKLNTQLEEEKEKNRKAWKENCRKLLTLNAKLAEKDAVIARLSRD